VKLTTDEIKLVVFVLLALVVGAAVKHYRTPNIPPFPPAGVTDAQAARR